MDEAKRITHLARMIAALSPQDTERFARIFVVDTSVGRMSPPPAMHDWIEKQFGSVDQPGDFGGLVVQRAASASPRGQGRSGGPGQDD
jgi:hypothetical protein